MPSRWRLPSTELAPWQAAVSLRRIPCILIVGMAPTAGAVASAAAACARAAAAAAHVAEPARPGSGISRGIDYRQHRQQPGPPAPRGAAIVMAYLPVGTPG